MSPPFFRTLLGAFATQAPSRADSTPLGVLCRVLTVAAQKIASAGDRAGHAPSDRMTFTLGAGDGLGWREAFLYSRISCRSQCRVLSKNQDAGFPTRAVS